MQCHMSRPHGSDGILLDASSSKQDERWCRAIARLDHGYHSYEMSADLTNLKPVNFGHVGFVFNVKDDKNYDFVYLR